MRHVVCGNCSCVCGNGMRKAYEACSPSEVGIALPDHMGSCAVNASNQLAARMSGVGSTYALDRLSRCSRSFIINLYVLSR
jgi:hypothetical protein